MNPLASSGTGTALHLTDRYLEPFRPRLEERLRNFQQLAATIHSTEGGLLQFSRGDEIFGLHHSSGGWTLREYLPGALSVSLIGDFNDWNRETTHLSREPFGRWSVTIPHDAMFHGQKYKLSIRTQSGEVVDRVPAWAKYVAQNTQTNLFDAVVWDPPNGGYQMKSPRPPTPRALTIYEAHIGMSSVDPKVSTYTEFRENVLPRIAKLGYNTIQLMAIMEHAYYGSFGYHVTSFFAPSSRFGTPDDLKELVDAAHALGITVLMDIVHSHMKK